VPHERYHIKIAKYKTISCIIEFSLDVFTSAMPHLKSVQHVGVRPYSAMSYVSTQWGGDDRVMRIIVKFSMGKKKIIFNMLKFIGLCDTS
jgi:hypothetical protein